jgi:hypothetical protein
MELRLCVLFSMKRMRILFSIIKKNCKEPICLQYKPYCNEQQHTTGDKRLDTL